MERTQFSIFNKELLSYINILN